MMTVTSGSILRGSFTGGLEKRDLGQATLQGSLQGPVRLASQARLHVQGSYVGAPSVAPGGLLAITGSAIFAPAYVEGEVQVSGTVIGPSWDLLLPTGPSILVSAYSILLVDGVAYQLQPDGSTPLARPGTTTTAPLWLLHRRGSFYPLPTAHR